MHLGFLTACLGDALEDIAAWASARGFTTLEIACWPRRSERDYAGSHIDVASPRRIENAQAAKQLLIDNGLMVSSLAYYENNLDPDPQRREAIHQHLRAVIETASAMQCPLVGTFIGRHPGKTLEENIREMREVFNPLLDYAGERDVKIMIENCPMLNWQFEGLIGNLAYSPPMWEEIFGVLPHENFGLNLDPSHLVWQGIDWCEAAREFAPRIFHVHAKDAEILERRCERTGTLLSHCHGFSWWRYRMPGLGAINWAAFLGALMECHYDSWVSIEHEDPVWEGSPEKVKAGLALGLRHLSSLLP